MSLAKSGRREGMQAEMTPTEGSAQVQIAVETYVPEGSLVWFLRGGIRWVKRAPIATYR